MAALFGPPAKFDSPTPPKKPPSLPSHRSASPVSSTPPKAEVIIAKVVHAYKLENGQYSLVGKLGIALAGSSLQNYLLILYKTKQEHLSVVTLTRDFAYSIRDNNYVTYYDGNKDNWSILFDSTESSIEFAREIAISKYFLLGKIQDSVFSQDLVASKSSESPNAEENDELELTYTIIQTITQPLKSSLHQPQTLRIRITRDDNWERSLIGVSKSLKKLLILPPSKQISLGPGYPREHDIAIELEVLEIIKPEERKKPSSPKHATPVGKASLISRMAKMGQSMLPNLPSTTTDSEDTEDEVQVKSPRRVRANQTALEVRKSSSSLYVGILGCSEG